MNERKNINRHFDLDVYKRAFAVAMRIFELTKTFPTEERYSLTDQIRRSSRSVCANSLSSVVILSERSETNFTTSTMQ